MTNENLTSGGKTANNFGSLLKKVEEIGSFYVMDEDPLSGIQPFKPHMYSPSSGYYYAEYGPEGVDASKPITTFSSKTLLFPIIDKALQKAFETHGVHVIEAALFKEGVERSAERYCGAYLAIDTQQEGLEENLNRLLHDARMANIARQTVEFKTSFQEAIAPYDKEEKLHALRSNMDALLEIAHRYGLANNLHEALAEQRSQLPKS